MKVDEIHLEMASREFAEIEIIGEIAKRKDVAVGIIDVKSYYVETPEDVADRVRLCLKHAAGGAAELRAGLRVEPDRAVGGAAEAAEHGGGREDGAEGAGCCMIKPVLSGRRVPGRRARPRERWATRSTSGGSGRADSCPLRGPASAARPVPLRLADDEIRRHRQAARADDRAGDRRRRSSDFIRRRHVEPQPHRPSRRRDDSAAAGGQPEAEAGDSGGEPASSWRSGWACR